MVYGDGTIRWDPRRKKWIGRYERHTGRAKRQRGWVSANTEAECRRKLREAKSISATLPEYDARMRLDTFLTHWLGTVQASVRPRTADHYASIVAHHIAPDLGGHKLAGLRVPHVEEWRDTMLARGDSPRSVSHRMKVLRYALEQAIRWEMLGTNVAAKAKGPHVPQGDRKPLSVAEARRFLAHVAGDPLEAVYWLALTLGMRQAEILGLRWSDVQLGRSEAVVVRGAQPPVAATDGLSGASLEVRKTLVWLHGRATLEDPKTERSHRTLTLHSRAVAALQVRRKVQNQERIDAGPAWNPRWTEGYDLVFADPQGYAIERTVVTRAFQRHLKAAGLPVVPFHDTRHVAVSWLLDLGMTMREVSEVMGHSRPSVTADVYSHLQVPATEKAARLLEEALA